jgi:hypothetical protein
VAVGPVGCRLVHGFTPSRRLHPSRGRIRVAHSRQAHTTGKGRSLPAPPQCGRLTGWRGCPRRGVVLRAHSCKRRLRGASPARKFCVGHPRHPIKIRNRTVACKFRPKS